MEHNDRVLFLLASGWNYPSLFDSCCFLLVSAIQPSLQPIGPTGVNRSAAAGPSFLHSTLAHASIITPSAKDFSPNYHAVRVPAISSCDTVLDVIVHIEILRYLTFSLVPSCQIIVRVTDFHSNIPHVCPLHPAGLVNTLCCCL